MDSQSNSLEANHMKTLTCMAVAACLLLPGASLWAQNKDSTKEACPDGQYAGKQSGRQTYYKEDYLWAVTREFAKRFCMPDEYIADDLKGAEAIAYRHKPSGIEACDVKDGKDVCGVVGRAHWIEIYVKGDVNIPKYDPEVRFFDNRDTPSSRSMIREGSLEGIRARQAKIFDARRRGEIVEPPGMRNPYRGFTPEAQGKHTQFHYLARLTATQVEGRPAAYSVRYFHQDIYPNLNLIALEGWGGGNFAGPRYKEAPLGYALGVTIAAQDVDKLNYPNGFLHVIEMPQRIMQVMNGIDRQAGQRFDDAMRGIVNSTRPVSPTPTPLLAK
jgi:hypothetical protein